MIEAAVSGLPIVATNQGGPHDIIRNCQNGILVDVNNSNEISAAIENILINPEVWKQYSQNGITGVREHYTWDAHTQTYVTQLYHLLREVRPNTTLFTDTGAIGKKFTHIKHLFLTDIDETLIGDDEALAELVEWLRRHQHHVGFGVVTGRPLESAKRVLEEHHLPHPDIMVSSVGTEIYYSSDEFADKGWETHISRQWDWEKIQAVLTAFPCLTLQEDDAQRKFKLSYYLRQETPWTVSTRPSRNIISVIRCCIQEAVIWIFYRIGLQKEKRCGI